MFKYLFIQLKKVIELHIGIIMDGNGRWAVKRGFPRLIGHHNGAKRVREIVKVSPELGVTTLTLYAFSTENWKRSAHEVSGIMKLFRGYLQNNLVELHEKNVRVRFLGDPDPLKKDVRGLMDKLTSLTKHNTGLQLNVAINYGGRDELTRAVRKIATKAVRAQINVDDINEETISSHLDTAGQCDPDLIIRTANEVRVSNFLTWQSVYSEYAFLSETWPNFTADIYRATIDEYQQRSRKFGAEEISKNVQANM